MDATRYGPAGNGPGEHEGVLAWAFPTERSMLSSAPVGGGWTQSRWVANIGVHQHFSETDLDAYVAKVMAPLGFGDAGVALLTAARIDGNQRSVVDGVSVDATVGISKPTWAADAGGGWNEWRPGTINLVVQVPCRVDRHRTGRGSVASRAADEVAPGCLVRVGDGAGRGTSLGRRPKRRDGLHRGWGRCGPRRRHACFATPHLR